MLNLSPTSHRSLAGLCATPSRSLQPVANTTRLWAACLPVLGLVGLLAGVAAQAQTAAAPKAPLKTAVAPAGEAARALGGGLATGRLLTRDELRSCMAQQDKLGSERLSLTAERRTLDTEREAIGAERQNNTSHVQDAQALAQETQAHNQRIAELNQRLQAWRERNELVSGPDRSGANVERMRRELSRELDALKATDEQLRADGATLSTRTEALRARATAAGQVLDQRAAGWNQRNKALEGREQTYEEQRADWTNGCGNRRYREDDEVAIKAGK